MNGLSILEHIAAHLPDDAGPGLTSVGYRLPDEQPVADGQTRWAAGALEGVLGRHTLHKSTAAEGDLLTLVRAARRRFPRRNRDRLYTFAMGSSALDSFGDLLQALTEDRDSRDAATGRWLAFEGRHRGPVSLGIALLALGHDERDRQRLLLLARHDDLSSLVMRALTAVSGDAAGSAFAVAQVAHGWGRVGAVDRLNLADPEVQRWLVCGGYVNQVMDEYTAINAAWADLLGQLQRIVLPDPGLVEGATGVLQTLVSARVHGGPGSDIGQYPEGPAAIELLLHLLEDLDFRRFQLAETTRAWLHLPSEDDYEIDPGRRQSLLARTEQVLADPEWPGRTLRALADPANPSFDRAIEVGRSLGLDIFPAVLAAVEDDPDRAFWWWHAANAAGPQRISSLVQLAERHLIRGSADQYGALVHHSVISVLQVLPAEQPGLGWPLVAAALQSRQSDRWPAYRVLERWARAQWPAEAERLLRDRLACDPEDRERKRVVGLLDGSGRPAAR